MTVIDVVSWACLSAGSVFCVIGGIGLLRLPDFYCRTHAAGITDTMGAGLILVGLIAQAGASLITVKLVTVWLFLWLTSPASTHAVAKAAHSKGVRVLERPAGGGSAVSD